MYCSNFYSRDLNITKAIKRRNFCSSFFELFNYQNTYHIFMSMLCCDCFNFFWPNFCGRCIAVWWCILQICTCTTHILQKQSNVEIFVRNFACEEMKIAIIHFRVHRILSIYVQRYMPEYLLHLFWSKWNLFFVCDIASYLQVTVVWEECTLLSIVLDIGLESSRPYFGDDYKDH